LSALPLRISYFFVGLLEGSPLAKTSTRWLVFSDELWEFCALR
jgi:hypothetical protein